MTAKATKEGAAKTAPDLVYLVNDKKTGFIFLPGGKLGPGESALVERALADKIIEKARAACHIRDPDE